MKTKPILMGGEVEYSMLSTSERTRRWSAECHDLMLNAIRDQHKWLPDIRASSGIYIDNGSRYYLDSGNHNELASPELSTPRQIAVYDRAGERILLRAMAAVQAEHAGIELRITKNNINFSLPNRATWGQHEAYTCWIPLENAASQLIPHLVSRIPFAGAGCLSGNKAGTGFELSQRARHMTRPQGAETTHDRAIFCTRAWKPSDGSGTGWTRTNLLSKDSQRCSFGMYLSYGTTALLFMIMNEGHQIGRDVRLKDSVAAMRAFSLDPWLKTTVVLANGRHATAVEIQRAYLCEAKRYVDRGDFPDWTHEVCGHWSATLDQLESDPLQLADRLDTYTKLKIFDHQLTRAGLTWAAFLQALTTLDEIRRTAPEAVVSAILTEDPGSLGSEQSQLFRKLVRSRNVRRAGIERLRFVARLQAMELNYHELGGLFDRLEAAGHVSPVVVAKEAVAHAVHHPPCGGRAEARSKSITEFHGQQWACDWQYVIHSTDNTWVDLRDPFSSRREVTTRDEERPQRTHGAALHEILERLSF
jgi:Pup-ligase protein